VTRVHSKTRKGPRMDDVADFRNVGPLQRADNDWYCDGPEATEALLRAERFSGSTWDPACGRASSR
jgi:hypothetical protein